MPSAPAGAHASMPARRFARIAVFRRIGRAGAAPSATRPASVHSRSSPSSTCQNALLRGSPGSKKCASTARMSGMLAASNQMMRWSLSLMWPCQHIGGVRIRSPVLHFAAPAVDDGGGAIRARGKADRRPGVAMRARAVAGLQHREGGEQRAGRSGVVTEGRMRHDQRAALDVVDRDLADRAMQERLDVAPAPDERRVLGLRLDRRDALVTVPQRMQVFRLQFGDEARLRG